MWNGLVWSVVMLIISFFAQMKTAVSLPYSAGQKGDDVQKLAFRHTDAPPLKSLLAACVD